MNLFLAVGKKNKSFTYDLVGVSKLDTKKLRVSIGQKMKMFFVLVVIMLSFSFVSAEKTWYFNNHTVDISHDLYVGGQLFGDGSQLTGIDGSRWNVSGTNLFPENLNYRVGIGTDSPQQELHVAGSLQLTDNVISPDSITFDAETSVGMRLSNPNGYVSITPLNTGWAHIYTDRSNFIFNKPVYVIGGKVASYSNADLFLSAGGSRQDLLIRQSDGAVGIGDTTPDGTLKLDVEGQIGATEYCDSNGANCKSITDLMNTGGRWNVSGTNLFPQDLSYNVGIGTSSPASGLNLDVEGKVGATEYCDSDGANCFSPAGVGAVSDVWVNESGDTMSGDLNMGGNSVTGVQSIISTANAIQPKIVLDSTSSGDNWGAQGAYITIGENGDLGAANLHMSYIGNGYGYIGSGSLTNGIPGASYLRFSYNSDNIYTPDTITAGAFVGDGSGLTGINASNVEDIWVNTAGDTMTGDLYVSKDTPVIRAVDTGESNKYIELRYEGGWGRIYTDGSNIYTNRYIRADAGFFVDGTTYGIDGTGILKSNTGATIGGNTAWHEGNDGSGSGLDADTLDGLNSSDFMLAGASGDYVLKAGDTMTGDLRLSGGTTPTLFFDSSQTGDFAIRANGEHLEFFEPEDSNKVHMKIIDDGGVNAVYGLKTGSGDGTMRIDSSGDGSLRDLSLTGGDLSFTPNADSAKISPIFSSSTNTKKSYISFAAASGSNDPGFIVHETSSVSADANKGVLHLSPSDDNDNTNDYVTIHGTNDPETIKLYTGGNIYTTGEVTAASFVGDGSGLTGVTAVADGGNADTVDSLHAASFLRSDASDTFTGKLSVGSTNSRDAGMYGIYDSTKIGHIWSMGTAYSIPSDGSTFGNLYGLAYKHTNNPTGGTMANSHQMVWTINGVPKAAMGDVGLWTSQHLDVASGNGNGVRFWQSDSYKISMGNTAEYQYGPVSDYSIKTTMSNTAARGWTWGVAGSTPVAAIATTGNMQIAGTMTAASFSGALSGTADNALACNADGDCEVQNLNFNNGMLKSSDLGSTNIDHIWHDDGTNTWYFNSDTTAKNTAGTGNINGNNIYASGTVTAASFVGDNSLSRFNSATHSSGSASAGWVTIATSSGSRGFGEVYVWDTESGDHSFMHLNWMRSYQDSAVTVVNSGGHARRLTGVRVIRTSDDTYGEKRLQVYSTTSSVYNVRVKDNDAMSGFTSISAYTPTTQNLPSGWSVDEGQVTGMTGSGGNIATTGDLFVGGGDIYGNGNVVIHIG